MSEIKAVYPLLDGISIGQAISERGGTSCYAAMNTATQEKFILKHISIPESQVQVEALILTGSCANEGAAKTYFSSVVEDLREEVRILSDVGTGRGFLPYVGYQIAEKETGVGFDAYLLGTYHNSLAAYAKKNAFTHLHAVNLAMDLCAALALCRQSGYLYLDLKPENVFMADGRFSIGDLGFTSLEALDYASFPDKYLSAYSAPELQDMFAGINQTVDIYALGLVLYQIYNGGRLPFEDEMDPEAAKAKRCQGEPLPAPIYADYEMAEIILKACAFQQEERWQTPEEMGQALISYMQRNDVTDSIIAPPIITDFPLDAAALSDEGEDIQEDAAILPPDEPPVIDPVESMSLEELLSDVERQQNGGEAPAPVLPSPEALEAKKDEEAISAMLEVTDDTAPNELDVDPSAAPAEGELADMLAQADDLIQHAEDVAKAEEEQRLKEEAEARRVAEEEARIQEAAEREAAEKQAAEEAAKQAEANAIAAAEAEEARKAQAEQQKAKRRGWISLLVTLAILAGIGFGVHYFYNNYYCIYVSGMEISESGQDHLTVSVTTEADPTLLTIRCTDTYGNTMDQPLVNGQATFEGLTPDTQYTVTTMVSGFHKLVGSKIQVKYATDPTTELLGLSAIAGQEDGSVILNLTVDGPEPEEWTVSYTAEGEAEQQQSFTGHMVSISGLTVGKTYTFQISASEDTFVTGNHTLDFTATNIVTAENLMISDFALTALTVTWDAPETPIASWTVRCFNDGGYDVTQEVTDCTATFDGIDSTTAYTVEVTAAGMTQGSHVYVSENPVVINSTTVAPVDGSSTKLDVSWDFIGTEPQGGWLLLYSFGAGENATEVAQTDTTSIQLAGLLPGTRYSFRIQTAAGLTVFDGEFTGSTPAAPGFSNFGITGNNLYMAMFPTPEVADWTFDDVDVRNYTDTFHTDDKIAFVVEITTRFRTSDENVTTTCVIRDENGTPVDYYTGTEQWHAMWTNQLYLGELERTPQLPGKYTLEIYFDGALAKSETFTITE